MLKNSQQRTAVSDKGVNTYALQETPVSVLQTQSRCCHVTAVGEAKAMMTSTSDCWERRLSPHLSPPAAAVVQPVGPVGLESPEPFHCQCVRWRDRGKHLSLLYTSRPHIIQCGFHFLCLRCWGQY